MFQKFYCTFLLACLFTGSSIAQICQGSLGDPIINISFGAGANPGPPLSGASTNYTYASTDCPKDGEYAVRNITQNCFDTTWFTVTDHTGDANGYFMIVNASYAPGEFYRDTVKGLCQGSTYEFAAWVINIKKPVLCYGATQIIDPDITFRIEKMDGTLIQTYNTNSISASTPPQWRQYGFFFTTPAGVSDIVVRMVNNAPGGCGNDLGLDDITFRPCGPQITSDIAGSSSKVDTLCYGTSKSYTFNAQPSPGYTSPTYQWQKNINGNWTDIAGATSTAYTENFPANTAPGNYLYRVVTAESGNISSAKCRVSSDTVSIIVTQQPSLSISSNSPVCEGATIYLTATSSVTPVNWTGPNSFSASGNNVSISEAHSGLSGKYFATINANSCSWKDSTTVSVTAKPLITVDRDSAKICQGDSIHINASGASNFKWEPSSGISNPEAASVIAFPSSATKYSVIGSNAGGCSDTIPVFINVIHKPVANAGADRALVQGSSIQLSATASGDSLSYFWTPDYAITGTQSLNPTVSPLTDTSYVLHVISTAGCGSSVDTMKVTIYKEIVIHNAFSPNGDGKNDVWNIAGINSYPLAEVTVFDRYGREVLHKRNFEGWDGKRNNENVPVGNYYYVIDLRNGSPKIVGWVYLTR